MTNEDPGWTQLPDRYALPDGGEAIDKIRTELGDHGFIAFCVGCAMKYRLRAGKKGSKEHDMDKAAWYAMMALHAQGLGPDPRTLLRPAALAAK